MDKNLCKKVWGTYLDRLAGNPAAAEKISRMKIKMCFICADHDLTLNVFFGDPEAPEGKCLSYSFDEKNNADLVLTQDSEGFHRFWHGRQDVIAELVRGKIKAEGDVGRALKVLPLLRPAFGLYPEVLQEMGLNEMVLS
ncbi:MAG: hypothetical protein P9M14_01610 [Candidatus Alcyoniella australis]|nr:hypothetical protein [Candidatus Alcyoniella australis]